MTHSVWHGHPFSAVHSPIGTIIEQLIVHTKANVHVKTRAELAASMKKYIAILGQMACF